jgi:hypothetical protein
MGMRTDISSVGEDEYEGLIIVAFASFSFVGFMIYSYAEFETANALVSSVTCARAFVGKDAADKIAEDDKMEAKKDNASRLDISCASSGFGFKDGDDSLEAIIVTATVPSGAVAPTGR